MAVGPTNAGKGRDIAMVFERPEVHSASTKIYRTHSHELHIKGSGFPEDEKYVPKLKFFPELVEGEDYKVSKVCLCVVFGCVCGYKDAEYNDSISKMTELPLYGFFVIWHR